VQPQQTRDQGDVRTEHKRLQREWTRSYGGAGVVPKQTPEVMVGCRSSASVFLLSFFFGEIWIFFDKDIGKWDFFCFSSVNSTFFSIF
jgi:hypothetical protein